MAPVRGILGKTSHRRNDITPPEKALREISVRSSAPVDASYSQRTKVLGENEAKRSENALFEIDLGPEPTRHGGRKDQHLAAMSQQSPRRRVIFEDVIKMADMSLFSRSFSWTLIHQVIQKINVYCIYISKDTSSMLLII